MPMIAIVYFSGNEHTHLMAEAIAEGIQKAGQTVNLLRITGTQIQEGRWSDADMMDTLSAADAIVFGSPTYMGGVAAQFKAFIDAASEAWFVQQWKDKLAAGFTHSSSLSGDKQGTLIYMAINAAQHSMLWVNAGDMPSHYLGKTDGVNRLGSFMGVMGQSPMASDDQAVNIDDGDRLTCISFGERIANAAQQWTATVT
ncbi:MAG: flavodoxin family protein [Cyanobacteria bacterium P01_H01_bin.152]